MSNEQAAPETKGVTAELLATVDLGSEIEGMAGRQELYPDVVDGCEEEGGVPSRLIKTDAGHAGEEGTPWMMFAESTEVARKSCSRWMSWRGRAPGG